MRIFPSAILVLALIVNLYSEELNIDSTGISVHFPDDPSWLSTERLEMPANVTIWRKNRTDQDTLCAILSRAPTTGWTDTNALLDRKNALPSPTEILSEGWTSVGSYPSYRIVAFLGPKAARPFMVSQYVVTSAWILQLVRFSKMAEPTESPEFVSFCKTLKLPTSAVVLPLRPPSLVTTDGKSPNELPKSFGVDFADDDILSVLRNSADIFQESLVIPADLPKARVSVKLRNPTFDGILELVLNSTGFTHVRVRNVVWIVRVDSPIAESAKLHDEIKRRQDEEQRFRKSVGLLLGMKDLQMDNKTKGEIKEWLSDPNSTSAMLVRILEAKTRE